jgi:hypothetical protein
VAIGGSGSPGGDGSIVNVTNDGNVETRGIDAKGIVAQSIGGGGGSASRSHGAADLGGSGGGGGDGGHVTVRTGAIDGHPEWKFWEITPDLAKASIRIVDKKGGAPLETMLPPETWGALNGGYWQPAEGRTSIDLNGLNAATIAQEVATTAGQTYRLEFMMAGNTEVRPRVKTLDVYWRG